MRRDDFSRRLMRENELSANDFIYPMFILDGEQRRQPVESMPGVDRVSIDLLLEEARQVSELGIPAITLSRGGVSKNAHAPNESWQDIDSHVAIQVNLLTLLAEAGLAD